MNMDSIAQKSTTLKSSSLMVTQDVIRAYAELTNDFNPIHVDAEFAATTPMQRPIAHGTISLCLMWQCIGKNFPVDMLGALQLDVRFVKPVYIDDELTAGGEPDGETSGQWKVWVRAQDGSDRIVGVLQSDESCSGMSTSMGKAT